MVISNTIQFIAFNVDGRCSSLAVVIDLSARVLVMEDYEEYSPHPTPTWKERLSPRTGSEWLIAMVATLSILAALGYATWTVLVPPHLTAPPLPSQSQAQSAMLDTEAQSQSPSTQDSEAQMMMSGRYEVTAEGKLLRPKDAPSPVLPRPGENMRFDSAEGMADFARYVVELLPYMWMSNDTQPLENIATPECAFCKSFTERIHSVKDEGGWVENVSIQILSATDPEPVPDQNEHWITRVEVSVSSMSGYRSKELVEFPPEDFWLIIQGYRDQQGWHLVGVARQEKSE